MTSAEQEAFDQIIDLAIADSGDPLHFHDSLWAHLMMFGSTLPADERYMFGDFLDLVLERADLRVAN